MLSIMPINVLKMIIVTVAKRRKAVIIFIIIQIVFKRKSIKTEDTQLIQCRKVNCKQYEKWQFLLQAYKCKINTSCLTIIWRQSEHCENEKLIMR